MLVEDDPYDAEMLLLMLAKNQFPIPVIHVEDGETALEQLMDEEEPLPALIMLDLRMPKVDGFDVLRKLRSVERTRLIPVFVFVADDFGKQYAASQGLMIDGFIRKPVVFKDVVMALLKCGMTIGGVVDQKNNVT